MTQQEMHIALCEWMGMTHREIINAIRGEGPQLPPLTLDWLHECVQRLNPEQLRAYRFRLLDLVCPNYRGGLAITDATKEQRLEALCRTLKIGAFKCT